MNKIEIEYNEHGASPIALSVIDGMRVRGVRARVKQR